MLTFSFGISAFFLHQFHSFSDQSLLSSFHTISPFLVIWVSFAHFLVLSIVTFV
jgi:hypothetical protein